MAESDESRTSGGRGPRRPGRGRSDGARGPRPGGPRGQGAGGGAPRSPVQRYGGGPFGLAPLPGGRFELVHPRCVTETEPDFEEGLELWRAGDPEGARDALRFALEGCHDNLWVHVALGKLAFEEFRDPSLARGHYGYAVDLVRRSIPPDFVGRLPRDRPANRPFYEAVDGVLRCLSALGKTGEAEDLRRVVEHLSSTGAPAAARVAPPPRPSLPGKPPSRPGEEGEKSST